MCSLVPAPRDRCTPWCLHQETGVLPGACTKRQVYILSSCSLILHTAATSDGWADYSANKIVWRNPVQAGEACWEFYILSGNFSFAVFLPSTCWCSDALLPLTVPTMCSAHKWLGNTSCCIKLILSTSGEEKLKLIQQVRRNCRWYSRWGDITGKLYIVKLYHNTKCLLWWPGTLGHWDYFISHIASNSK